MPRKSLPKRIWLVLFILSLALLAADSCLTGKKPNFWLVSGFFIFNLLSSLFLLKKSNDKISIIQTETEHSEQQINIFNAECKKRRDQSEALKFRINRYDNLKKVIENLNRSLKLDKVIQVLSSTVYSLISNSSGTALFYLVDNQYQRLNLVHSIKDDSDLVIQSKEGDIFDHWVLRHSAGLIIEELKNDFRFDSDAIKSAESRPIISLISSPLISHNSLLGLLRLESRQSGFFNQDDLRFLSIVSELGAVALENSLLFQKTQDLAIHDDLTRLFTRAYFITRLKEEAKRSIRLDRNLSLLMIDIDFFKQYNDKYGHTAGDIVLKKVGALLKSCLSEIDSLLCRFGGEEFLIMLPGLNKQRAVEIAETLRKRVQAETIVLRRQDTHITVSIGAATMPVDTKDEDELVQKADMAMYKAKEKGRNKVCTV